jgi:hypothetical protein
MSRPSESNNNIISPLRRWQLVGERAYFRALERGFWGGNPFDDWLAAEAEIDARYDTSFRPVFSLTDASEMVEHFRTAFASYRSCGFDAIALLERHRTSLENLAEFNRRYLQDASALADKQAGLIMEALDAAAESLHSFSQGRINTDATTKQALLAKMALENAIVHVRTITKAAMGMAADPAKPATVPAGPAIEADLMNIRNAVVKAYAGKSLQELTKAPISALRGVSAADQSRLSEAFRIATIRDLAGNRFAEWARGIVILADSELDNAEREAPMNINKAVDKAYEGQSLKAIADAPVDALQGISERQATLLQEAFRIKTVRDLANNRFFRTARGIVILADTEA